MGLGLTAEHEAIAASIAALAARHAGSETTRRELDAIAAGSRPACWPALVESGFLALPLPEHVGGGGAGAVETAVAAEAAGRALLPGPVLPTLIASLVLADAAGGPLDSFGPQLANGAAAAVAVGAEGLSAEPAGGGLCVTGTATSVLGAPGADVLVLAARTATGECWFVTDATAAQRSLAPRQPVDLTRGVGDVTLRELRVSPEHLLGATTTARVRALAAVLVAAEASGVARWCFETALSHVKVREQFGRPVGSFQAVKHKAASLFVRVEVLAAAAWDAARAVADDDEQLLLAAASAAALCPAGARDAALEAVTLLGGIGYTWEHDVALYWRRAVALAQLLGPPTTWQRDLGGRVQHTTRTFGIDVDEPEFRARVAAEIDRAAACGEPERRQVLAEAGLVAPHYPPPYGIGATAAQQVVIGQEYARAGLAQPTTVIGEFALPTILAHGTPDQQERFLTPTLRGELTWCQLFSEPDAGSDLASLRTRAEQVPDGWRITGQKVWSSKAHQADWAICLARTDPDAPKHKGISYFLVDMSSDGIDVRPLRQTTGRAEFNEVFLDGVFVPDDCLVGAPGEGWRIATTTLANERLMIASGTGTVHPLRRLLDQVRDAGVGADDAVATRLGALAAESLALDALNLRAQLQRLEGLDPGAATSVLKLASTEHRRAVATTALELAGPRALTTDAGDDVVTAYLSLPAVLIGGGTREIQLNVVAERVLGLPRG